MELILFHATTALYTISTVLAFVYLYYKSHQWSSWMLRLLTAGVVIHLASFGFRLAAFWATPENRFFLPVNSFFGALSYMSLAVAVVFALVEGSHRLGILGAFVLPWAALGTIGASWRIHSTGGTELAGFDAALQSYWMNIHPMLLMAAYAVLGNAFGVGLALIVQERQVKSRRPSELCYRLPAIEVLDYLNYQMVASALPLLMLGIVMGGIWAHGAWGRFWGWDAKETWALITVLVYVAYLYLHWAASWRGKKSVYLSMIGFACALFTFFGVNSLSNLHGYLSKKNVSPFPLQNKLYPDPKTHPWRPAGRVVGDMRDQG